MSMLFRAVGYTILLFLAFSLHPAMGFLYIAFLMFLFAYRLDASK